MRIEEAIPRPWRISCDVLEVVITVYIRKGAEEACKKNHWLLDKEFQRTTNKCLNAGILFLSKRVPHTQNLCKWLGLPAGWPQLLLQNADYVCQYHTTAHMVSAYCQKDPKEGVRKNPPARVCAGIWDIKNVIDLLCSRRKPTALNCTRMNAQNGHKCGLSQSKETIWH